ncbi:MAG TPA: YsnF/AvaK domain-containing protein [Nitrososphaera sp.]|nr:YsnF/AvaK domain-containing protein [Nitrososphaera sp.]
MDNRPSSSSPSINWSDVIKKEARGTDTFDLGEVQEIAQNYIVTQRGTIDKEKYYIPKYLVHGYDGETLWFDARGADFSEFLRDSAPQYDEYRSRYKREDLPADIETRIPVLGERLDVSKRVKTNDVTISKEPVTETKTVEVPVTHEEVRVERRPADDVSSVSGSNRPVGSRTEIKVPVTSEEVEVTKQPYVKEEVVVSKEPVTETRTVSDTVQSERVNIKDSNAGNTEATRTARKRDVPP